jgi:membrane associated rhomboid family serine protease
MGIADRYIEYRDNYRRRRFTLGQPGNALIALITLNIVFFLLILLTRVFYLYTSQGRGMDALQFDAIEWFALPGQLVKISERPWTLVTFMFSHGGQPGFALLINVFSNMLWLYAFGFILQDLAGNKLIFPVYIYGSLAGVVFFVAALYAVPSLHSIIGQSYLSGAGTGTMALAIAVTTFAPGYRLFRNIGRGIPVWVLSGLYLLFNLVGALGFNNANSFAILGGALAGYGFVFFYRRDIDGSVWMNNLYEWFSGLFRPGRKTTVPTAKEKVFYNTGKRTPYSKTSNITQQRVDEILDKISQKGYHMLTEDEKNLLKRASEE